MKFRKINTEIVLDSYNDNTYSTEEVDCFSLGEWAYRVGKYSDHSISVSPHPDKAFIVFHIPTGLAVFITTYEIEAQDLVKHLVKIKLNLSTREIRRFIRFMFKTKDSISKFKNPSKNLVIPSGKNLNFKAKEC